MSDVIYKVHRAAIASDSQIQKAADKFGYAVVLRYKDTDLLFALVDEPERAMLYAAAPEACDFIRMIARGEFAGCPQDSAIVKRANELLARIEGRDE